MSRDLVLKGLGGVQRAPGTKTLHNASVPSISEISKGGPKVDSTLVSEETITYQIKVTPFPQEIDGGLRAEQLISEGDILFGTRAGADPLVSVFTLDYVNILLQNAYLDYKKLIVRKISSVINYIANNNPKAGEWISKTDYSHVANITLQDLMEKTKYYPTYEATRANTNNNGLPSQLGLFIASSRANQLTPAKKSRLILPKKELALSLGQQGVAVGLTNLLDEMNTTDQDEHITKITAVRDLEQNKAIGRDLVKKIFASIPQMTQYLTVDGICCNLNCIGIMVSSQDDTNLQSIQDTGGIRNLNVAVRGPVRVVNFWASNMVKGSHLSLLITRTREDNDWGAFCIKPHWSVVDNKNTNYSTSSILGPIDARPSRLDTIPTKEYSFKDLSGRDALGHIIQIGKLRYPVGDSQFGGDSVDVPMSSKATILGLAFPNGDKISASTTVRKAFTEKQKMRVIDVYINM